MRGMSIDKKRKMGTDIHYYTGSTTGTTSRNNEMCSQYAPIMAGGSSLPHNQSLLL